jgi:hypothetical protein
MLEEFSMISNLKCLKVVTPLIGIVAMFQSQALAEPVIDPNQARQYFEEAKTICEVDSGHLWGRSLCLPMMFVDRQTGSFVANENNQDKTLEFNGGVFTGKLPMEMGAANTAIEWGGKRWTMVLWPLPANKYSRADLMLHESFHGIEPALGLSASVTANAHLDTYDGRLWLQLEWLALREALKKSGEERNVAVQDALLFREYRRQLFPLAVKEECQMEMHEGLAQYTGHVLCGLPRDQIVRQLGIQLDAAQTEESLVSSFAYWSGSAYGLLLDIYGSDWRKGLTSASDFGQLLRKASGVSALPVTNEKVEQRLKIYDGAGIRAFEDERKANREQQLEKYRGLFVDGPTLLIPLQQIQFTYNPSNLCPLDTLGTVYPTMRLTDLWGTLEVEKGALMARNMTNVILAAPADTSARPIVGDGWVLQLQPGWTIRPGERRGDMVLQQNGSSR